VRHQICTLVLGVLRLPKTPSAQNTHANHPREVTPEFATAVDRLLRHGIPVGNQTVLLKGVNDPVTTTRTLMTALLRARVRPCYPINPPNHVERDGELELRNYRDERLVLRSDGRPLTLRAVPGRVLSHDSRRGCA
jgi:hypothetical protein